MNQLLWNEGMSVGIEAIDNDHKKIIQIINAISDAIDSESTEQLIDSIFSKLEHYVSSHFAREENLLKEISYPKYTQHQKIHQQFIDKIPELKSQLFRNDSLEVAEKINSFLHEWIINHILIEDMDYAQLAHTYRENQKSSPQSSPLKRLTDWLNRHLNLSARFILAAMLPIFGILLLSFIILNDNYQQYKNMLLLSGMNSIIYQVNTLSHNLQSERGLSSGFISSNSQRFSTQLSKRRQSTDKSIALFFSELNHLSDLLKNQQTQLYISQLKENLSKLSQQRIDIDQSQSDFNQLHQFYSQLISSLLKIGSTLTKIDMNSKLANNIIAINSILSLKEVIGQERALGTVLIEKSIQNPELSYDINSLQGEKFAILQQFNNSANEKQKEICGSICEQAIGEKIPSHLMSHFISERKVALTSQQWFEVMSNKVDQLKSLTDQLINELNHQTEDKLNQLLNRFYLVLAILGGIFLLNTLLSILLSHSIITPIRLITHVLKEITSGNKSQQVYEQFANDEIGKLFQAYEKLRRKLLQADISEGVIHGQKKYLQFRKHENAHYKELASIDALTGALNRRKFDEIIEEEILYAQQHQSELTMMLLDIDHFKNINDTYGHTIGDQVLQLFYQLCYKTVRFSDVVARFGGEEFIILMPQTNLQQAAQFAERVREVIHDTSMDLDKNSISITVSVGVAQWDAEYFKTSDEFINFTDQGLYEAKNLGRDQVVIKKIEKDSPSSK